MNHTGRSQRHDGEITEVQIYLQDVESTREGSSWATKLVCELATGVRTQRLTASRSQGVCINKLISIKSDRIQGTKKGTRYAADAGVHL